VKTLAGLLAAIVLIAAPALARTRARHHRPTVYRCQATAFSVEGITRAGTDTHYGMAASDPRFLPLGTVVRVSGAGRYSGTYTITDTGAKVDGRHIDIYLPNDAAAKEFGRKVVTVRVVKWGAWKENKAAVAAKNAEPDGR
jgi:3D (Asp-Asp-Asp) domain-containing protein